jgi:LmbE family N-acetylglucosaminyl deacetylase
VNPIDALSPIDAPGTGEDAWRAWPGLAQLPPAGLGSPASVVVLAAHPDDEVLGAGGILCLLASAGVRLRLVAVTDGEASHRGQLDPGELIARRCAERAAALRELGAGAAEVIRLRLPDSGLDHREPVLTTLVRPLLAGFDACLAPWENDVHADHEAVGRAARRAAPRLFFYPVWMWHWARPGDPRVPWPRAIRVPLTATAAERKRTAIGCFASQLGGRADGLGPVLEPGFVAHFTRDFELLFPAGCR